MTLKEEYEKKHNGTWERDCGYGAKIPTYTYVAWLEAVVNISGKESWSWADIEPNWTYEEKGSPANPNPWNENARNLLNIRPTS